MHSVEVFRDLPREVTNTGISRKSRDGPTIGLSAHMRCLADPGSVKQIGDHDCQLARLFGGSEISCEYAQSGRHPRTDTGDGLIPALQDPVLTFIGYERKHSRDAAERQRAHSCRHRQPDYRRPPGGGVPGIWLTGRPSSSTTRSFSLAFCAAPRACLRILASCASTIVAAPNCMECAARIASRPRGLRYRGAGGRMVPPSGSASLLTISSNGGCPECNLEMRDCSEHRLGSLHSQPRRCRRRSKPHYV